MVLFTKRNIIADRGSNDYGRQQAYEDINECIKAIEEQPTADVRENEKGEWEEIAESGLSDLRRCSNCGHIEAVGLEIMTPKPNYCPFCGADMRPITALSKKCRNCCKSKKR